MKIIVASDSFKGSLTSGEIADLVEHVAHNINSAIDVMKVHIADGGEGTVDAFLYANKGTKVNVSVCNPFGETIQAAYALLDNHTAVIEVASVIGLPAYRHYSKPVEANSYGVGQLVSHALHNGCKKIIIGLGGSCTTDGGIGMAAALGFKFYDKNNAPVPLNGYGMGMVESIQTDAVMPELLEAEVIFACDVTNPMYGPKGAAHVFAPQKGGTPEQVQLLDKNLEHFAQAILKHTGVDVQRIAGTGAAGGMCVIPLAFAKASICSGLTLLLQAVNFDTLVADADLVITGEGRLDEQSLSGKVPVSIAKAASKHHKPVVALVGEMAVPSHMVYANGLTAIFPIIRKTGTLAENIENSKKYYEETVCDVLRLFLINKMQMLSEV